MKWLVLFGIAILFVACSSVEPQPERSHSKWFVWTVPEPGCGNLIGYDLRWTTDSTKGFEFWTPVLDGPYPGSVGTLDSCLASDLPNEISFGRIKSQNSYGHWSVASNVAIKDICEVAPAKITDLQ